MNNSSFEDPIAYDSLLISVYTIIEDALHLSDEPMDHFLDYPCEDVHGFRNIVAHRYRKVSKEIAWKVISKDLPELVKILEEYHEFSQ